MMLITAAEVWHHNKDGTDFALIVANNTKSGCWSTFALKGAMDHDKYDWLLAMLERCGDFNADATLEELVGVGFDARNGEFAMEKAAIKHARRLLGSVTRAAQNPEGWEPAKGWEQKYKGDLTMQEYDERAGVRKLKSKVEKLAAAVEEDDNQDAFGDSDDDFAARRRRKLELKRRQRELEQEAQGGA